MPMRPIYSFRRLAAGIVLGAAFLAAAPPFVRNPEELPKMGGMIRVRDFTAILKPELDPAVDSWIFVTQQIFEGLVRLDNKLDLRLGRVLDRFRGPPQDDIHTQTGSPVSPWPGVGRPGCQIFLRAAFAAGNQVPVRGAFRP